MSPIPKCKDLLLEVEDNPEALLYLLSGAIDRLNQLEEGSYTRVFKEAWTPQDLTGSWN
jgi:hypothetical protein